MKPKNLLIIATALLIVSIQAQEAGHPQDKEASPQEKPAYRVSPGAAEGNLLRRVDPRYPQEAKRNHIQGDVILQTTIDRDGSIRNLRVVYGAPVLAQAAVDAVRQWKYRPFKLKGEPVAVETAIKIRFHL